MVPDLPGRRHSSLRGEGADPADPALHARALVDLLDLIKVHSAHVVGHSWGGLVAQRLVLDHPDRVATLTLVDSAVLPDHIDDLDSITCPALIVWAENDSISPVQLGRSLSRVIPRARLAIIPDVGAGLDTSGDPSAAHVPPLYSPEEFNRYLLEFLTARR